MEGQGVQLKVLSATILFTPFVAHLATVSSLLDSPLACGASANKKTNTGGAFIPAVLNPSDLIPQNREN